MSGASSARALAAALALASIVGCGSGGASRGHASEAVRFPVAVENCGARLLFHAPPRRVATADIDTAEDMIALGLGNRVAGAFSLAGDQSRSEPAPEPYPYAFRLLHEASPEEPQLETLERMRADFLFAGWWNYGLEPATNMTPQVLAQHGIKTLALSESCAQVQPDKRSASIEDTYRDLENLGAIFGVRHRAADLVAQMRREVSAVHAMVAKYPPVSVFLYANDPSDPVTALGLGEPTALIALAGGRNVFASIRRTWRPVRWSEIASRRPQCILVEDYAYPSWREKVALLRRHPAMRDVPAVRHNCFVHLSFDQLAPGPRNAEAVLTIARRLHPQAFAPLGRPSAG